MLVAHCLAFNVRCWGGGRRCGYEHNGKSDLPPRLDDLASQHLVWACDLTLSGFLVESGPTNLGVVILPFCSDLHHAVL